MNKNNWTYKKLGEVCTFTQGMQVPIEEQSLLKEDGFVRFLRIIDFTQGKEEPRYVRCTNDKYILHNNEIAIVRYGTPGFVCYGKIGAIANNLFKITPNQDYKFNSKFLVYWLNSNAFQLAVRNNQYGVALQAIKFSTIHGISIPIPPLSEQQRIVYELDLLSSIIEKKKTQLKEYDQLAQSIFYDMFGDPITNERGWEVKAFEDTICNVVYTKKLQRKDYLENGLIPIISQEDEFISGYWNNVDDAFKVDSPVVIFGDHTRVIKYIDFSFVLGADGVKILKPINDINTRYFFSFLKNCNVPSLGYSRHYKLLKELFVPLPPLSLQQEFAEKIEAIEKQKSLIQQSIDEVQTMFDYTMDKYFG